LVVAGRPDALSAALTAVFFEDLAAVFLGDLARFEGALRRLVVRAGDLRAAFFELGRRDCARRVTVREDPPFAPARVGRFLAFFAIPD